MGQVKQGAGGDNLLCGVCQLGDSLTVRPRYAIDQRVGNSAYQDALDGSKTAMDV